MDLILPSGVSCLDRILGGGLRSGLFTHIYGEAASGKTTLALQFTAAALKLGHKVVYINSEGGFPFNRLEQISSRSIDSLNMSVRLLSPTSFQEQGTLIEDLDLFTPQETSMVVIDTLARLYRTVLEDKETSYAAHRELNRQAGFLKGLAYKRNLIVLVVNQVRARMTSKRDFEPVAKNILEYWSDYEIRIDIRKETSSRTIQVIKPKSDPSQCVLTLTQDGLSMNA